MYVAFSQYAAPISSDCTVEMLTILDVQT